MHDVTIKLACLTLYLDGWHAQSNSLDDSQAHGKVNDRFIRWRPTTELQLSSDKSQSLVSLLLAATPSFRGSVVAAPSREVFRRSLGAHMKPAPMVPWRPPGYDSQYTQWVSVYNRMSYERIITMFGVLDDNAANQYIALLLYLQNEDAKKKVTLYVNIPAGSIEAGLALYDTMSTMTYDIETVNLGFCGDLGAFIVAGGTKGMRGALPSSKFRMAGPRMYPPVDKDGNPQRVAMQAEDVRIEVMQVLRDKHLLLQAFSKFTGKSVSELENSFRRDFYLTAPQAVEYGLVDRIIEPRK